MQDIFTEVKLPEEFLNDLAKQSQDEGLINVIGSTITGIVDEIGSVKFNESHRSVAIRVCHGLSRLIIGNDCSCPM
jgi:hypothetical protein